uniref:NADH-ubiquinone oxidoreductase chain 2 n=1 Tax=Grandidierella japonica TaxID=429032 RepID=A0A5H2XSG8_GRAJA|nr:NADH dehydrogenase subunit 2 [Grandidierella japonica]
MMLLHPSNIMFLTTLFMTIILAVSTDSWFVTWVALEMNIMVFLPMLLKKKNKYQSESALKYFLTQIIASIMILLALMQLKTAYGFSCFVILTSLMLKMAAAPLHKWMPALVNGLNWESLFILLILQKVVPFTILSLNNPYDSFDFTLSFFIIMSALTGALMVLFQSSLMKMLAYSSIAHSAWMLTLMMMGKLEWLSYFMIYSIINMTLMTTLAKTNMFYLSQLLTNKESAHNKAWIMLGFLSLGGLPPLSGFFPKMMAISVISASSNNTLLLVLLLSSLISLFMYLRVSVNSIFMKTSQIFEKGQKSKNLLISVINTSGLFLGYLLFV